jgi:hypothetical protein
VVDFDVNAERPSDGSYAEIRGSRISAEDQYYEAVYGKAGAFKVEAFVRDMPNLLSTDAKPIWNGVGTNNLTLKDGLVPGGSTSAQVAAVSASIPVTSLGVERNKQGIGLSDYLSPHWTVYLNASDEERKGDRPYGGPFFFNFLGIGGGSDETVKPIDDSTVNVTTGVRYAGSAWRLDVGYSGSVYRDRYLSYSFQQPFTLGPALGPGVPSPISEGQMSMEPDNEYHNLRATVNLFPCDQWNTTAALSQTRANMLIVTTLTQASLVLQPTSDLTVRGGAKYYREDYRNNYLAYNPENGFYGYPAENGAEGSIVPGEAQIWNPTTYPIADDIQVRNIPYSWQTIEAFGGVDWRFSPHDTAGLTYTFDRDYVDDDSIKLNWTDKSVNWLTFRFNYTFLKQSGSVYDSDPYAFAFFQNLPGFLPSDDTVTAWTVNAQRKYDLSDRTENKIDLMATLMPRPDMTVSASLRGDWNQYPTQLDGRRDARASFWSRACGF